MARGLLRPAHAELRLTRATRNWPAIGYYGEPRMTLALKWIRRIGIAVVGFTVLCIGVCMIVLPGPAFIVIPAGLGILALEFAWARRWPRSP